MYRKEIIYMGLYKDGSRIGNAGFLKVENREAESRWDLKLKNIPFNIRGRFPIRIHNGKEWKEINGISVQEGGGSWEENMTGDAQRVQIQIALPGGYFLEGRSRNAPEISSQPDRNTEKKEPVPGKEKAAAGSGRDVQERENRHAEEEGYYDIPEKGIQNAQNVMETETMYGVQDTTKPDRPYGTQRTEGALRPYGMEKDRSVGMTYDEQEDKNTKQPDPVWGEKIERKVPSTMESECLPKQADGYKNADQSYGAEEKGERTNTNNPQMPSKDPGMRMIRTMPDEIPADMARMEQKSIHAQSGRSEDKEEPRRHNENRRNSGSIVIAETPRRPVINDEARQNNSMPGYPSAYSLKEDKWEQILDSYEQIHPYGDERVYVKLEPKDFIIFQSKYQHLVNNSFLLHGFYNYRYVILGKEGDYYLGVPGVFYEREKMVALMFGFEAFECPGGIARAGEFGYYLRKVEL